VRPQGFIDKRGGFTLSHPEQVSQLSLWGKAPMSFITNGHSLFAQSSAPSTMAIDYSLVAQAMWHGR
jgi:hypothetical protein